MHRIFKTPLNKIPITLILFLAFINGWSCPSKDTTKVSSGISSLCIELKTHRSVCVKIEIADTEQARARGLMFRQELDQDAGMLFFFPNEGKKFFWMKNTYIPLDMIFINSSNNIVGILENVEPMTTKLRSVDAPSKYVLEVNGGWVAKNEVKPGLKVKMNFNP